MSEKKNEPKPIENKQKINSFEMDYCLVMGAVVFVVTEAPPSEKTRVENYMADGLIFIHRKPSEDEKIKKTFLDITKMRGVPNTGEIYALGITSQSITRPSWDEYYAKITLDVAARSTCTRRQFGAIIINEQKEIMATGYNGVARGAPHCDKIGCIKDEQNIKTGTGHEICPAVHAEQNALIQAGRNAVGGTLYINGFPCKICARLIVNAGIRRVVVSGDYSDEEGLRILEDANVRITYVGFPCGFREEKGPIQTMLLMINQEKEHD